MWRIAAILAAIAAFVYIAVVGVQWLQPRVEDDILNRVNAALAEQGMLWADVTVSGRQVVLGGHAPDEASHAEALNVASRVFGVASVSDATIVGNVAGAAIVKPSSAYQLTITKHENTLTVGGDVASEDDAAVIRRIVKTHFPDMQVQDTLKVNPRAPSGWRSAVGVVLMNITNLETANITISNTEVMLQGEVLDQKYSDQLQDAIKQALPKGYKAGFAVDVVTPAALAAEEAQDNSATTVSGTTTTSVAAIPTPTETSEPVIASTTTTSDTSVVADGQPGFLSRLWSSVSGETSETTTVSGSSILTSMTTVISSTMTSVTTAMKHHHHGKHEKVAPVITMTSHTTVATKAPAKTLDTVTPTTPVAPKTVTTETTAAETPTAEENPTALTATDCHGMKRVAHTVIYFGFDKAGLPQKARPVIHRVAATLKSCPAQHVTVNGYTDTTGSQLYNKWLSEQRAESGVRALRRQGVAAEQLSAVGHGEHHARTATKAERAHSRRIEFHPDGKHVDASALPTTHSSHGHAAKSKTASTPADAATPATNSENGWWNSMFGSSTTPVSGTAQ